MDVGLLDDVQSRGTIQVAEREPFYQMLGAAGRIDSKQLIRAAQDNLEATRARWAKALSSSPAEAQRALAQEVIRRADEGRYSVAPLFNEPQQHVGELGRVRRHCPSRGPCGRRHAAGWQRAERRRAAVWFSRVLRSGGFYGRLAELSARVLRA